MLSLGLLYDEAINSLSTFLSLLYLSLPLSCFLSHLLSLSSHLFLSFHLSPVPPFPIFLTFWFNDWRLQIATEFHHKPHSALTALVASCQTHKDMLAHTQAYANMPPEPYYSG